MSEGKNGKESVIAACCIILLMLTLAQLTSTVASASDNSVKALTDYWCSDVENDLLADQVTEAVLACYLPDFLTETLFQVKHRAQLVNFAQRSTNKSACLYEPMLFQFEYRIEPSSSRTMLKMKKFVRFICRRMQDSITRQSECVGGDVKNVTNLFLISTVGLGYGCGLNMTISKNYVQCNDYKVGHLVCTSQRNHSLQSVHLGACGFEGNPTLTQKIEVLYSDASGKIIRLLAPLNVKDQSFNHQLRLAVFRPAFCDFLLLEALKIIPEYTNTDVRIFVLLRLFLSNGSMTYERHTVAVRMVRDQHELHVVYCDKNETKIEYPIGYYYKNATINLPLFAYLPVEEMYHENIDYYSMNFWKTENLTWFEFDDQQNFNLSNWMKLSCKLLLKEKRTDFAVTRANNSNHLEHPVKLYRSTVVTSLLKNISRKWTMSILLTYTKYDIKPNVQSNVDCEPPYEPIYERIKIPISEDYLNKNENTLIYYKGNTTINCHLHILGITKNQNTSEVLNECFGLPNATITFNKEPIERASGPQFQSFAYVNYNKKSFCENPLRKFVGLQYKEATALSYLNSLVLYNRTLQFESTLNVTFIPDYSQIFLAEFIYHEVDCDERYNLTYWNNSDVVSHGKLLVSALEAKEVLICGNTSSGLRLCSGLEANKLARYFNLGRSIQLTKVVKSLCKTLQHLPVGHLIGKKSQMQQISVKLEYQAAISLHCGSNQRTCNEEETTVKLKLKVREYDPWVYKQFRCSQKDLLIEERPNVVFALSNSTDKLTFDFSKLETKYCKESRIRELQEFGFYFSNENCIDTDLIQTKDFHLEALEPNRKNLTSFCKDQPWDALNALQRQRMKNYSEVVFGLIFLRVPFCRACTEGESKVLLLSIRKKFTLYTKTKNYSEDIDSVGLTNVFLNGTRQNRSANPDLPMQTIVSSETKAGTFLFSDEMDDSKILEIIEYYNNEETPLTPQDMEKNETLFENLDGWISMYASFTVYLIFVVFYLLVVVFAHFIYMSILSKREQTCYDNAAQNSQKQDTFDNITCQYTEPESTSLENYIIATDEFATVDPVIPDPANPDIPDPADQSFSSLSSNENCSEPSICDAVFQTKSACKKNAAPKCQRNVKFVSGYSNVSFSLKTENLTLEEEPDFPVENPLDPMPFIEEKFTFKLN